MDQKSHFYASLLTLLLVFCWIIAAAASLIQLYSQTDYPYFLIWIRSLFFGAVVLTLLLGAKIEWKIFLREWREEKIFPLALPALIFFLFNFSHIEEFSIWLDEYTQTVRVFDLIHQSSVEQQPALPYFVFASVYDLFGAGTTAVRLPALIAMSLSVFLFSLILRFLNWSWLVRMACILSFMGSTLALRYSVEARPFAFCVFTMMIFILSALLSIRSTETRWRTPILLFSAATLFLNSLSLFPLALVLMSGFGVALFFLRQRDSRLWFNFIQPLALSLLVFLPQLYLIVQGSLATEQFHSFEGTNHFIRVLKEWPWFGAVLRQFGFTFGSYWLVPIVSAVLLIKGKANFRVLAVWLLVIAFPVLYIGAFYVFIDWHYTPRYMIGYGPIGLLGLGYALHSLRPRWPVSFRRLGLIFGVLFSTIVLGSRWGYVNDHKGDFYGFDRGGDQRGLYQNIERMVVDKTVIIPFNPVVNRGWEPEFLISKEFYMRPEILEKVYSPNYIFKSEKFFGPNFFLVSKLVEEREKIKRVILVTGPEGVIGEQEVFDPPENFSGLEFIHLESYTMTVISETDDSDVYEGMKSYFESSREEYVAAGANEIISEILFYFAVAEGRPDEAEKYSEIVKTSKDLPDYLLHRKSKAMEKFVRQFGQN